MSDIPIFLALDTLTLRMPKAPHACSDEARLRFGMTSVLYEKHWAWQAFRMTSIETDICLEWQLFVIQVSHEEIFYIPIASLVFLRYLPGHEKSTGIIDNQIGSAKVLFSLPSKMFTVMQSIFEIPQGKMIG